MDYYSVNSLSDIDLAVETLNRILGDAVERFIPIKRVRCRKDDNPWFNSRIRNALSKKKPSITYGVLTEQILRKKTDTRLLGTE